MAATTLGRIFCIMLAFSWSFAAEWGYYDVSANQGPNNWHKLENGEACGLESQSPINIDTRLVVPDPSLISTPFSFQGYDTTTSASLSVTNNGHTINVPPPSDITLSGGGLPGTFKAVGFHFHWGESNDKGSEHTRNGIQYPLELHIVHLNSKYADVAEGLGHEDGLAVLGVFFQIGALDANLRQLTDALSNVQYKDSSYSFSGLNWSQLLPSDTNSFYRYSGSLTTPPCSQVVTWTVFSSLKTISEAQLNQFRMLSSLAQPATLNKPLVDNFREPQPLNDRKVYASKVELFEIRSDHWDYEKHSDEGPMKWSENWPHCAGKSQSPINIITRDAVLEPNLLNPKFTFDNFNAPITGEVVNDGHSVKFTPTSTTNIFTSGGGLQGKYQALQFHFHWGSDERLGSEHQFNGNTYPVELHIVHRHETFSDTTLALHSSTGLAVLGIMLEVGGSDNPDLKPITDVLSTIKYKGDKAYGITVNWNNLLPSDTDKFYRYLGSLTTPGCFEAVVWTVFNKPIQISANQLKAFQQNLYSVDATTYQAYSQINNGHLPYGIGNYIKNWNNYRPTQLLYGRRILASHTDLISRPGDGHASISKGSLLLLLLSLCLIILL